MFSAVLATLHSLLLRIVSALTPSICLSIYHLSTYLSLFCLDHCLIVKKQISPLQLPLPELGHEIAIPRGQTCPLLDGKTAA